MNLTLRSVKKEDYKFLYKLLKQRPKDECISHRKMPSYKEHVKYLRTFPFFLNIIILVDGKSVGNLYETDRHEIGIHVLPGYDYLVRNIVEALICQCGRSKERIYFNINPKDKRFKSLLRKHCRLIQHTYENIH